MLLAGVILDIRRENKHENEIDLRNEWLDIKAGLLTHPLIEFDIISLIYT